MIPVTLLNSIVLEGPVDITHYLGFGQKRMQIHFYYIINLHPMVPAIHLITIIIIKLKTKSLCYFIYLLIDGRLLLFLSWHLYFQYLLLYFLNEITKI